MTEFCSATFSDMPLIYRGQCQSPWAPGLLLLLAPLRWHAKRHPYALSLPFSTANPLDDDNLDVLIKYRIPPRFNDACLHLLIPLRVCQRQHLYMPFSCRHQKHEYEECLYKE